MRAQFQLAYRYLKWYFSASSSRGHGIHSPFVYNFIRQVLMDDTGRQSLEPIEELRKKLKKSKDIIAVADFGAGSTVFKSNQRIIGQIAASSLKPPRYSFLLYKIARFFKPCTILELGTSLGITTSYLATAVPTAKVYTLEGSPEVAKIARQQFEQLSLKNIELLEGDFKLTFIPLLAKLPRVDLAFVDGNHQKEPTIAYFNELLKKKGEDSVFIFDDIYWSPGMETAWETIKEHPSVTLTIDIFFMGLVFFRPGFSEKQHFKIRF